MRFGITPRRSPALATLVALSLSLTACSSGSLGSSGDKDELTLDFLVPTGPDSLPVGEQLAKDFSASHPDIKVNVETRPGGGEGDNVVKTRLATGEMADVFLYNTGSLFQAIDPEKNLVPMAGEDWVGKLDDLFVPTASVDDKVYGAPAGSNMGGGVLYNRKVYADLDLEVPKTWDEFMENNAKIKDAGIAPVIQTYQETWTSQLFVLGDYHNVAAAEPDFAKEYTANDVKFATSPAARRGFERLQEVHDAGYLNKGFGSATYEQGLRMIGKGEGAHYPMLTNSITPVIEAVPEAKDDMGFFALPGEDAAKNGLTAWSPAAAYIPKSTEGEKLTAAKKFLAFIAGPEGCKSITEAQPPSGPYSVKGCKLPADAPQAVKDTQRYFEDDAVTPALEFLSPVKGPALEQICIEVGSGIRPAKKGAQLYDKDVAKQAKQLGLKGW
ncbi:ABC transporter substrate-binding protein [Streptomyces sp. WMMB 322]|uniref:ABC transporter substrate-binding protein n=1 Tax=Streptomyces sp. WMMB 322 TaxID=1286821 RepID=UPI0006E2305D|nr:extracellular solute-binding protein [Streptomyces sp. WMMB 322]SCK34544.1 carbohydrate ABC transporter substrate-binding protein, CUT1 family [Streptomyces sp. WMMB 322]